MRKASNITVKRKRIGEIYNKITLPKRGDVWDCDEGLFEVICVSVVKKPPGYQACIVIHEKGGETTLSVEIYSIKPFRK